MAAIELKLTNNFYTFARTVLLGDSAALGTSTSSGYGLTSGMKAMGELVGMDGTSETADLFVSSGFASASFFCFNVSGVGVTNFIFGSGYTAPALRDYALEAALTDVSASFTAIKNASGITFTVTATNGGTAAVNINEIGMTHGYKNSQGHIMDFLAARAVLAEPVTIAAGESAAFTVALTLPTPQN